MKKEISNLEFESKHYNFYKTKMAFLKSLRRSFLFTRCFMPYILSSGLIFYGGKTAGLLSNKAPQYLEMRKEIDNYGNVKIDEQYGDFEDDNCIVTRISKWHNQSDGMYARDIEVYKLKELSEKEAMKIIENEDISITEVLGNPVSSKKQIQNNLSEEELAKAEYINVVLYSEDSTKSILVPMSLKELITMRAILVIVGLAAGYGLDTIRKKITKFSLKEELEKINSECITLDHDDIDAKLKIVKENYNTLTR